MPSLIWTKGPVGGRLVQCWGAGELRQGGSESLALAVSLYATTLGTAAIGTIGRPISHRDSTICFPFPINSSVAQSSVVWLKFESFSGKQLTSHSAQPRPISSVKLLLE